MEEPENEVKVRASWAVAILCKAMRIGPEKFDFDVLALDRTVMAIVFRVPSSEKDMMLPMPLKQQLEELDKTTEAMDRAMQQPRQVPTIVQQVLDEPGFEELYLAMQQKHGLTDTREQWTRACAASVSAPPSGGKWMKATPINVQTATSKVLGEHETDNIQQEDQEGNQILEQLREGHGQSEIESVSDMLKNAGFNTEPDEAR